jgi:hypothetical protein
MIAIGLLFVRMLCDYFKSRPQLEAEIVILRHQLNLLHGRNESTSVLSSQGAASLSRAAWPDLCATVLCVFAAVSLRLAPCSPHV